MLSGNEDGVITCEDNFGFNKELECIPATCDLIATEDNNILDNVYAIVGVVKPINATLVLSHQQHQYYVRSMVLLIRLTLIKK